MTEEKKEQYFFMSIGYIGVLLLLVSQLRYMLSSEDSFGRFLSLLALLCIGSYYKYI
ncbi:hypothetical protein [Aquibacillus rhizosphaerae]|uniref:Uncharacterized protein n=1 Tax=Aquibacillus rhizosphaerae TaxID=3051431 RepID=A0ABT7L915_9BACI|nr:hypothetical protein [Aquibacillus sp. LR5S19]MDL4842348.1 hypothetical protein [Aquibacillus sp. LR5S19]